MALTPVAHGEHGPNPEQRGDNSYCLDHNRNQGDFFNPVTNELWVLSQTAPTAEIVDVEAGTWFTANVSGNGTDAIEEVGDEFYLEFWDEAGDSAGEFHGTQGLVPEQAAYATVCVGATGIFPDAPNPQARWTYQDGYHDPFYEERSDA